MVGEDQKTHVVAVAAIPRSLPAAAKRSDDEGGRPPTKPRAGGRSSADNLRSAVASGRAKEDPPAPKGPGPAKDLHSSILDELADLGLGPLPAASTAASSAAGVKKKAVGEAKLTIKTGNRNEARSHSNSRAPAARNPTLPSLPVPVLDKAAPKGNRDSNKTASAKKVLSPLPREKAKSASGTRSAAMAEFLSPSKTSTDPAVLKAKLETLEASLADEREVSCNLTLLLFSFIYLFIYLSQNLLLLND